MGLINKIKLESKKLALAGILGISGCGPVLMGIGAAAPGTRGAVISAFGAGYTQLEAEKIEAEGRKEATELEKDEIKQKVRELGQDTSRLQKNHQEPKIDYNKLPIKTEEVLALIRMMEMPGICFASLIDANKNEESDFNEPIVELENSFYNNSIAFIYVSNFRYGGKRLRYIITEEDGRTLAKDSLYIPNRNLIENILIFNIPKHKRILKEKGLEKLVTGIKKYKIKISGEDNLSTDSTEFSINYDIPYTSLKTK